MSFNLTTPQMRARTKTVTRRLGWEYLKAGDQIMACEKCMGRKPGEPLVRIHAIEVVSVRRERLFVLADCHPKHSWDVKTFTPYALAEMTAEGFPEMTPMDFIAFFMISHKGVDIRTVVTRIEFNHIE